MGTSNGAPGDESLSVALATSKKDLDALTPAQRAAIVERKNANVVTAQIAGTNWGKGLDTATQRAIADWGLRHGIDTNTEIHVLGGNIYLNAQFYINRLVDLVRANRVLDFRQRFINADARLKEIGNEVPPPNAEPSEAEAIRRAAAEARNELRERRRLRIEHNVPEGATSAVLTEVILVAMPHTPFAGVKWAPRNDSDPIGSKFPQETALTRSARRALKQCVRHLPEVARYVDNAEDDAVATIDAAVAETAGAMGSGAARQIGAGSAEDVVAAGRRPHGTVEEAAAESRIMPAADYLEPPARMSAAAIDRASAESDPYTAPGAPAAPSAPAGPVAADLFGGVTPMEPTAEERAAAAAGNSDEPIDDTDLLNADELRELERLRRKAEK